MDQNSGHPGGAIAPQKRRVVRGPIQLTLKAVQRTECRERVVIGWNQRGAAFLSEVYVQFLLAFFDAFHAAKPLEVGESDVGDHAVGGVCDAGQEGNFPLVVGAHLDQCELYIDRHGEQGQGHPDVVVQVARCGVDVKTTRQHRTKELFGGRLAIASGEPKYRTPKTFPVQVRHVLQRGQDVFDPEEAVAL